MTPRIWVILLLLTAIATASIPVALQGVSSHGVIVFLAVLTFSLLSYVAGLLTNRATRRAILSLSDIIKAEKDATSNLLSSYLLVIQMGQQRQTASLDRIERKIEVEAIPDVVSDRRLREYLQNLRTLGAIRTEDLIGLIELLSDALATDEDKLVVNGRCLVCGSTNPTLLEYPIHVKQAHHEDCPIPDRARLVQEVGDVIGGSTAPTSTERR